jgi:GNAT superfamily N-acetyltransferase
MRTAKDPPNLLQLNILQDVFYILFIQVDPKYRGQGHGHRLYELCEELAKKMDCREIRQTPAGGPHGGTKDETREDYLLRRDWTKDGNEVFKTL